MTARLRKWLTDLSETFWLLPASLVLLAVIAAFGLVRLDRGQWLPDWLFQAWLYDGGATGARTLLGAIISSTIGVAGTVFSITIAALSLAAGQMGPRLLRNFIRDRGNQLTLGIFLGTFSFSLIVLRSVRTNAEGGFIPHLSLSIAIALAFLCVATLIYFVGHMAGRINVDTVIELVSDDLGAAIRRVTVETPQPGPPPVMFWTAATPVVDRRRGYLRELDEPGLAAWAAEHNTSIRLLVRPGDYVFPGAPIALMKPAMDGAETAIENATALGTQRISSSDLRFAVRQLVEVAVRALSPGINDPHTAIAVVDRLGVALCEIQSVHLPTGVRIHKGRPVLVVPHIRYDQLLNSMFHMIRQSASGNATVLMRQLEVLAQVASCERNPDRMDGLRRHGDLVLMDADRYIHNESDLADLRRRHELFLTVLRNGPMGLSIPSTQKPD